ncbi:hypothetical protein BDZ97DRAFT_1782239 [Flammula alnicola]|nr:hypothetical protein BDZ97DRAFT_1782239 [Flammula alnicola]
MVVNRKQPAAPPQAVSRSSSTQPVPTKRQPSTKNATKPTQNGGHEIDSPSAKTPPSKSSKQKAKKRTRSKSFVDRLFLVFLSIFTFYAFYACRPNPLFPNPSHTYAIDPNPLCRSLSVYRKHILEPYILPPVKHTLSFTHDLAEPYITATQIKVQPYIDPVVRAANTAKPYVVRLIDISKSIWNDTVVPFYKATLKPYYVNAVLPRYRMYIEPRLAPLAAHVSKSYTYYVSRPLHIQATRLQKVVRANHQKYIQPYILQVQPYVLNSYDTVRAVTLQATDVYTTHVHPRLLSAWIQARPILCSVWKHTKNLSLKAAEVTARQLKYAAREAGVYRRTYVDPHVRKIWEKVAEGTESASVPTTTTPPPLVQDLPDAETEETAESVEEPTSVVAAAESSSTPVPTTAEVEVENIESAVPTPEEPAESVVHAGVRTSPPPPVDAEEEPEAPVVASSSKAPEAATTDVAAPTPEAEIEESAEPTESATTVEIKSTAPTPNPVKQAMEAAESIYHASLVGSTGEEEDLDDFLRDIGAADPEPITVDASANSEDGPTLSVVQGEQDPAPSDEEKAAAIAAKRAAIVARHDKWFEQLGELVAEESASLVKALEDLRAEKKAELAEMSEGKAGSPNTGFIAELQKEGERLVKGLETYLRKALSRSDAWKLAAPAAAAKEEREQRKTVAGAEKEKWATVLSKVEAKFGSRVSALQGEVEAWFVGMREREIEEARYSAVRVKNLAERAQADLGLDYAWLEDVTYADWQKYHDLMREYEEYQQIAYALQNGTALPEPAPAPPADPIIPALDALHNDLQDVVLGFQVALGSVRGEAAKVFSLRRSGGEDGAEEEEDEEDSGFFVVKDGETRRDDLRDVDVGGLGLKPKDGAGVVKKPAEEDGGEVRILPIGAGPGEPGEALDPSNIFIGKDKVQVEQALEDVPLEPPAVRHEEL